MELYVLDSLLRRETVVDAFESCVWTERFNDVGDLTLHIHSSLGNRNLLTPGTYLAMNRSKRLMKIDTVEDVSSADGSKTLVCTGSSIESVMDERAARGTMASGLSAKPRWVITGLPAAIARQMFNDIMVEGLLDAADVLPFYAVGNSYPSDTITEPEEEVELSIEPSTLLPALITICKTYDLGFRITRNADSSELFFNVYSGNDRTSSQTVNPPVIFSPALDNLENSSYLTSTKQYRNIAYVFGAEATIKVYDLGVDPLAVGFTRRVLPVAASDLVYPDRTIAGPGETPAYTVSSTQEEAIKVAQGLSTTTQFQSDSLAKLTKMQRLLGQDDVNINTVLVLVGTTLTGPQISAITAASVASHGYDTSEDVIYNAMLKARGVQELAKNNNITAFDGEIPQYVDSIYDLDYFLGDIVEMRNNDGIVNQVRVTEEIFSQDESGEKNYPTLSSRLVITPGVWGAWDANQNWADVDDTEHWGDLS